MKVGEILAAGRLLNGGSMRFTRWLEFVLEWECVFNRKGDIIAENDPNDAGGLTFAGIDRRSHPDFPFAGPTPSNVAAIYLRQYWQPSRAEELGFPVGEVVANFAVNMGLRAAAKLLQTAINQIPAGGSCRVDGGIGPETLKAAKLEPAAKLADLIEDEADERYRRIVQLNPRNRGFLQGWLNRDNALEAWWMKLAE